MFLYFNTAAYCSDNDQCPPDLACKENQCKDPCEGAKCGANAKCWVIRHHATCVVRTCEIFMDLIYSFYLSDRGRVGTYF